MSQVIVDFIIETENQRSLSAHTIDDLRRTRQCPAGRVRNVTKLRPWTCEKLVDASADTSTHLLPNPPMQHCVQLIGKVWKFYITSVFTVHVLSLLCSYLMYKVLH